MHQEEKKKILCSLRRSSYRNLTVDEWKIPSDYDYSRSTTENYEPKLPEEFVNVGRFKEIRERLDLNYHGYYIPSRQHFQDALVDAVVRQGALSEHPWIVFTAGPMGAGKSHTLEWMHEQGYFPLAQVVQLDPDKFKTALPEWEGYVKVDMKTAGLYTQKESGLLVEIGQSFAMQASKNIWIDGSFRYDYREMMLPAYSPSRSILLPLLTCS